MNLSEFDFDLPEELIAQTPLSDRASSRLLVIERESGRIQHLVFRDIVRLLEPGDLLVLNDTRVSARRLLGTKDSGLRVEALIMSSSNEEYLALTKPAKKLRIGDRVTFDDGLTARVVGTQGGGLRSFVFEGGCPEDVIGRAGSIPLPPYIRQTVQDEGRYQTVYASTPGSAAAPTAGLHFTDDVFIELKSKGVHTARVTLDVGLDTFRPVQSERIHDHSIHGERCVMPAETAQAVRECTGRIIAVGTTSVRTLESFATGPRCVSHGEMVSRLFVTPGYKFQVVDGMLTNFHMPKTTMLFMVAAMAGHGHLKAAYKEAVQERYRFLSFGDSMLVV